MIEGSQVTSDLWLSGTLIKTPRGGIRDVKPPLKSQILLIIVLQWLVVLSLCAGVVVAS